MECAMGLDVRDKSKIFPRHGRFEVQIRPQLDPIVDADSGIGPSSHMFCQPALLNQFWKKAQLVVPFYCYLHADIATVPNDMRALHPGMSETG